MDLKKYRQIKAQMKTGDLLQWRSHSALGAAIRWRTKSHVNHSSLVIRLAEYEGLERRRFTTEALSRGIMFNLLSRELARYRGEVWWYPLKESWNEKRQGIGEVALSLIGTPYDYKSFFRLLISTVSADARALFCSEYCFIAYGFTGQAPTPADMPSLGIFEPPIKL